MRDYSNAYPPSWGHRLGFAELALQGRSLLNALPVIVRELRAESRRPLNYWLRVLASGVLIVVFALTMLGVPVNPSQIGATLFRVLHGAMSLAIWVIVPLMTSDCISREKREGTLGLLFLTPLTTLNVILGKAASHVLRATTLVVASLPVLVLPFMLGGVGLREVLFAFVSVGNALLLGIAAGLYASAKGGSAIQVMVMAECHAFFFYVITVFVSAITSALIHLPPPGFLFGLAGSIGASLVIFSVVIRVSEQRLRESWNQDAAAPEQPRWVKLFSESEFWRSMFHWDRGPALDRNPIAWLQEYSWTARLTKWGWLTVVLVVEFFLLTAFPGSQPQLTAILAMGVAFSAVGSFRRERQSGLLEMVLVTPISERQVIGGRLWGICGQFFPALTVLFICWYADRILNVKEYTANPLIFTLPNPLAFVALIVLGLYMSLLRLSFFTGWLLTWSLAFLTPAVMTLLLRRYASVPSMAVLIVPPLFYLMLIAISWFLLQRHLERRAFLEAAPG